MKRCFALLLIAFLAILSVVRAAFDMTTPATVRVTVVDEAGQPVAGAGVEMVLWIPPQGTSVLSRLETKTDVRGNAEFSTKDTLPFVYGYPNANPTAGIRVSMEGFMTLETQRIDHFRVFPASSIVRKITLERARTTVLRFEKPDGNALPFVNFFLPSDIRGPAQPGAGHFADEKGEYHFLHGKLELDAEVRVAGSLRAISDSPAATIRLSTTEMAKAVIARPVEGRVLLDDGKPAAGWTIAWQVHPGGMLLGNFTFPSLSYNILRGKRFEYHISNREAVLPSDGTFRIQTNDIWLFAISPQGIPFRFPINARAWPESEAIHHITLRIPPLRRMQRGQLVYSNGYSPQILRGPGSGLEIGFNDLFSDWGGFQWRVVRGKNDSHLQIVATTDANGRYEVPVYFGDEPYYRPTIGSLDSDGMISRDSLGTVTPYMQYRFAAQALPKRPELKHVWVSIEDESGTPIAQRLGSDVHFEYQVPNETYGHGFLTDSNGLHAFVPANANTLVIKTADMRLVNFSTSLPLENHDEQWFRIRVPEALMPRPLSGIVLDPDGKPAAGVNVTPYVLMTSNGTPIKWPSYLELNATTDGLGRFKFSIAPAVGGLRLDRTTPDADEWTLPGWTVAPEFSRDKRDLVIRLSRGGSVRVLYPTPQEGPPVGFVLSESMDPARSWSGRPFDRTSPNFFTTLRSVPPGRYTLTKYLENGSEKQEFAIVVDVEAQKETLVDLTKTESALKLAKGTVDFLVTLEGRPFSGAVVCVLPAIATVNVTRGDVSDDGGHAYINGTLGETVTVLAEVPGQWRGSTQVKVEAGQVARIELQPYRE